MASDILQVWISTALYVEIVNIHVIIGDSICEITMIAFDEFTRVKKNLYV
jgi:hypothetical protein